ncbi:MAG: deoxyribodipyrimidine photo-lyase [Wenzhouxiangella sp.]|nr:MAG: deoxyribodipyrimidine photo-lyase [Wenzhouxiangella sp.]
MTSTAIVWFRRDLRLADNPALDHARSAHDRIVPVFIWDPDAEGDWKPGSASRWWLHHSLVDLDERLRQRGSRLILARGQTAEQMNRIRNATGAEAIYWNRLYEPAFVDRDSRLKADWGKQGTTVRSFGGALLFEPQQLLKGDGSPYLVFTPFWKRMQQRWSSPAASPEPRVLQPPARWPVSECIENLKLLPDTDWASQFSSRWRPGELPARRRLDEFVDDRIGLYDKGRDRPDRHATSRLSPHLHFGELSPGQVVRALNESGELPAGQGALSFLREIAWREFSAHLLFQHPGLPGEPLKEQYKNFPWRARTDYADDLEAWQRGTTGIPMVDAGMRELWQTGWMHNRVRMIVASFLTKNLLVPWVEGARWFWDTLVDADLANNSAGWQWTAGCGADAAPYFRVFNPVLQGQKFDPDGTYVRRWCPELAGRSGRLLHQPVGEGESGHGYPRAIVDLKGSRARALAAFDEIRKA